MSRVTRLLMAMLLMGLISGASADGLPDCLNRSAEATVRSTLLATQPAAVEVLARLAYAEGLSTGFPGDAAVYEGIAWGVMNRVRLAAVSPSLRSRYGSGVEGVVFQRGQFNPAVSPRSSFAREFLCPRVAAHWLLALAAAQTALRGENNPLIETPWERAHGLSLVVNFYYPRSPQARGPLAPWEYSSALAFVGPVRIGGALLPAERIRFYRLRQLPRDVAAAAAPQRP